MARESIGIGISTVALTNYEREVPFFVTMGFDLKTASETA